MAKNKENKQEFVSFITPRSEDFSQWYTDVITQTQLCDYAPVRRKRSGRKEREGAKEDHASTTKQRGFHCRRGPSGKENRKPH